MGERDSGVGTKAGTWQNALRKERKLKLSAGPPSAPARSPCPVPGGGSGPDPRRTQASRPLHRRKGGGGSGTGFRRIDC